MKIYSTPLAGLRAIESTPHMDNRGQFTRLFCDNELSSLMGSRKIVQINHSRTTAVGAVRGMHYQLPPYAEMKLVRCIKGSVWDVVLDLRHGSPTFLHWHAEQLSAVNNKMMLIPEGFAHGFQVLEPDSELLYLHTASYTPGAEGGFKFDDPMFGIAWPLIPTDLSLRDASFKNIDNKFQGIPL